MSPAVVMKFDTQLAQRQEQRLALLPQMLQSIEVLQMATVELLARIDAELEQNETLEVRPPVDPAEAQLAGAAPAHEREPDEADDWDPWHGSGDDGAGDRKQAMLQSVPAAEAGLLAFVREQIAWRDIDPALRAAVELLAEHLDERGLLPLPATDLAAATGLDETLLAAALAELQGLEPRGIGAAGPVEAMLLQIAGDPDAPHIEVLLRDHLPDLARNRIAEVARAMGLSGSEVRRLLDRIRGLEPRPGARFHDGAEPGLRPDARVWRDGDEIAVALDDGTVPDLAVNQDYEGMLRQRSTDRELRDYLRAKVRSARDLIDAIAMRRQTLARVIGAVMQHQPEFLAVGRGGIRPLRMADLAATLGLHTSTVSRAIAGKHVQTDHGVIRLRDFFDGGAGGAEAAGTGRVAVRETLAELVRAEDRRAPLSDDDLVAALAGRGITVARRTVTKYRKELNIPSSFLRRREEA